jgi:hypothetical protein
MKNVCPKLENAAIKKPKARNLGFVRMKEKYGTATPSVARDGNPPSRECADPIKVALPGRAQ